MQNAMTLVGNGAKFSKLTLYLDEEVLLRAIERGWLTLEKLAAKTTLVAFRASLMRFSFYHLREPSMAMVRRFGQDAWKVMHRINEILYEKMRIGTLVDRVVELNDGALQYMLMDVGLRRTAARIAQRPHLIAQPRIKIRTKQALFMQAA